MKYQKFKLNKSAFYYTNKVVNKWIKEQVSIPYNILDETIQLTKEEKICMDLLIENYKSKGSKIFNDSKPVLKTDFFNTSEAIIVKSDYFKSLVSKEKDFKWLSQSDKTNKIGVSCWAFTQDEIKILINKHSIYNNVYPDQYTCSAGGNMDFSDIYDSDCFKSAILLTARRELLEEAGISDTDIKSISVEGMIRPNTFNFIPIFIVKVVLSSSEDKILKNTSSINDIYTDKNGIHFKNVESFKNEIDQYANTVQLTFDLIKKKI
jgi:predicted NUDIX family phosphoesterase